MKVRAKIDLKKDITALILAGGRGSRMGGQDKGFIDWRGAPLIDAILEQTRSQTPKIIISANRNLDRYHARGYPVIPDDTPDYPGPLAGVLAAMKQIDTPLLVTLPCDAPVIAPDYIARLADGLQNGNAPVAVCHDGQRMQPLHALISADLRDNLASWLQSGERAVNRWFRDNHAIPVDFSDAADMFANINTPDEYQDIRK